MDAQANQPGAPDAHHHRHRPAAEAAAAAAVVSSSEHNHETTDGGGDDSSDDSRHGGGGGGGGECDDASVLKYGDPSYHPDPMYDGNMDDEDEAWVFRNMRGGITEEVAVEVRGRAGAGAEAGGESGAPRPPQDPPLSSGDAASQQQQQQQPQQQQQQQQSRDRRADLERVMMLKPRSSDAVLSCPCCFEIVCMDCQRHVRYANQFRAMFVMNIGVRWDRTMEWDETRGELVEKRDGDGDGDGDGGGVAQLQHRQREQDRSGDEQGPDPIPCDDPDQEGNEGEGGAGEEVWYPVHCASCQTEVAALNMGDEVYHFFGCLASS